VVSMQQTIYLSMANSKFGFIRCWSEFLFSHSDHRRILCQCGGVY
jgi:hypothetical protein